MSFGSARTETMPGRSSCRSGWRRHRLYRRKDQM